MVFALISAPPHAVEMFILQVTDAWNCAAHRGTRLPHYKYDSLHTVVAVLVFFLPSYLFVPFLSEDHKSKEAIDLWGWPSAFSKADTEENQFEARVRSATIVCGYQRLPVSVSWNQQTINHYWLDRVADFGFRTTCIRIPTFPLER